jgi:hypothetical protein
MQPRQSPKSRPTFWQVRFSPWKIKPLNELIESFSPEKRKHFGLGQANNMTTIEGFLALWLFNSLVPLALAFFLVLASANVVAGA